MRLYKQKHVIGRSFSIWYRMAFPLSFLLSILPTFNKNPTAKNQR